MVSAQILKRILLFPHKVIRLALRHIELVLISGLIVFAALQYYFRPQSQSLEQVIETGILRVLIADEPDSQYVFNQKHYGFEYELLSEYAASLGVELELDVVPYGELFTLLEGGFGDLAVGGILNSDYVARVSKPTIPWYRAQTTVVYRRGTKAPRKLEDFAGKRVLTSSRYYQISLLDELELVDDHRSEYRLLSAVNEGTERFVLSTNYRALSAKHYLPNLNRSFILPERIGVVWALPKRHDEALLVSINSFLAIAKEDGKTQNLAKSYFKSRKRLSTFDTLAIHRNIESKLPKYEYAFRRSARRGGVDWQLLAALAYQESKWSNDARSPTGVRGIMQLTTETANFLGVDDRLDMTQSIDGAARYIKQLRARLPKKIAEPERTWFAVGAYNIGFKHIMNAYRTARDQGLDRTKWKTISDLLPTLYGKPFSKGVQAQNYVERIQIFTDILRFYDLHLRPEVKNRQHLALLEQSDQNNSAETGSQDD